MFIINTFIIAMCNMQSNPDKTAKRRKTKQRIMQTKSNSPSKPINGIFHQEVAQGDAFAGELARLEVGVEDEAS